ncbi:FAD-dependent oxidoreductase [Rhodobaculum claviforme]|uniref:3-ketosteroid dehydrogenase n=1 Tax=Rhodobaculum claviforme TaxID=1549854 RepID=A0A934TLB2_9RHOB|nr:FAD-dependent oxidoreductase [Rhodobaculum claviforme]MBK5927713.1 3-ketosteroid dehydrogenase [Rhodobaculum claviforme]
MSAHLIPPGPTDVRVQTLIVGAGAAGLVAALAASEAGQEVLVLERDAVPAGSTALSAGLVPAAGTRFQAAAGIDDDAARFAADIQRKAHGTNDPGLVALMARNAAPALEWLADRHDLPFSVVEDVDYPGHTRRRMHGLPTRSGAELIDALRTATEAAGVDILTGARAEALMTDGARIHGIGLRRPDGRMEHIGCGRLILACNGFGGNPTLVGEHMPQIAGALYFGHPGNQGEAMVWGRALGAEIRHPGAFQGHGNVAHPHGILITWAVITAGGFQVNRDGRRFWNETQGYSEAARAVLAQPGGTAVTVFDARAAAIARQFADFRTAEAQGAIRSAATPEALAALFDLRAPALSETLAQLEAVRRGTARDPFGRPPGTGAALEPPYMGVRVTGALFHTQGGLAVDGCARVRRVGGGVFDTLHAVGGAACGVSGDGDSGYLSGNGLLSAVTLGRIAGAAPLPG